MYRKLYYTETLQGIKPETFVSLRAKTHISLSYTDNLNPWVRSKGSG